MPRPNPASAEANSEILVHFMDCESELLEMEDTFIEKHLWKTRMDLKSAQFNWKSVSGTWALDGNMWQYVTLWAARQWQLGGTYLSLFLNSNEVSWYLSSLPRISVQMTAHSIIIHSKDWAMFQLWTFDRSLYNQNIVRFGQPSRIFLTSMCNYTFTSLSLTQCHTAIHSVNPSYAKSDMATTVCRKNLQGVKLPSICEVYCEAAFFFPSWNTNSSSKKRVYFSFFY